MANTYKSRDEPLPDDGHILKCTEREPYIGSGSGWSDSTFKAKGGSGREAWRCGPCRSLKAKGGDKTGIADLAICLADITWRPDALAGLSAQVGEIKDSIELLSQKYDDILNRQVKQEKEINSVNNRVDKVDAVCTSGDIRQPKATVNDLALRSKKLNIEVDGVQVTQDQDLLCKLNEVAKWQS